MGHGECRVQLDQFLDLISRSSVTEENTLYANLGCSGYGVFELDGHHLSVLLLNDGDGLSTAVYHRPEDRCTCRR